MNAMMTERAATGQVVVLSSVPEIEASRPSVRWIIRNLPPGFTKKGRVTGASPEVLGLIRNFKMHFGNAVTVEPSALAGFLNNALGLNKDHNGCNGNGYKGKRKLPKKSK